MNYVLFSIFDAALSCSSKKSLRVLPFLLKRLLYYATAWRIIISHQFQLFQEKSVCKPASDWIFVHPITDCPLIVSCGIFRANFGYMLANLQLSCTYSFICTRQLQSKFIFWFTAHDKNAICPLSQRRIAGRKNAH